VQDAMKAQLATRPHPYYWASFELTGAIGPIPPPSKR
jgi:CHAT domain-containing protein